MMGLNVFEMEDVSEADLNVLMIAYFSDYMNDLFEADLNVLMAVYFDDYFESDLSESQNNL